jgi:hypothetical protein
MLLPRFGVLIAAVASAALVTGCATPPAGEQTPAATSTVVAAAGSGSMTKPAATPTTPDYETNYLPGGRTLVLPAFRVYMASGYQASQANVAKLKVVREKAPALSLVNFDANKNNNNLLFCRASFPVYGPNRTPFATLVESAVNIELATSGPVKEDGPRIKATLDQFDFSSVGTGKWIIQATFTADGKEPLTVKHEHEFELSLAATKSCSNVTAALPAGLQSFLGKVYSEPKFALLSN